MINKKPILVQSSESTKKLSEKRRRSMQSSESTKKRSEKRRRSMQSSESTKKPSEDDLLIATNTIQTLALLQTKTQGNLDEEEGKLLEAILAELRGKLPG